MGTMAGTGTGARVRFGAGDRLPAGPNVFARWFYLGCVSALVPQAIASLSASDPDDARALDTWAQRWGFTDDWARWTAHQHAKFWREDPTITGRWILLSVGVWWPSVPPCPPFDPVRERRSQWLARMKAHETAVLKDPGAVKTPVKAAHHFEWLALHHVGGLRLEDLAEKYQDADGLAISTISEAIESTALLIGLTLRTRPGRHVLK